METSVTTNSRKEKAFGQNFFKGIQVTVDGYPHLSYDQQQQITFKELEWFLRFFKQCIYVHSPIVSGIFEVSSKDFAHKLFETQQHGLKFVSLTERIRQALPSIDQLHNAPEPVVNSCYNFDFYINGILEESRLVRFIGLTKNFKFYKFRYEVKEDNQKAINHLLNVGHFPGFVKRISPDVIIYEQYLPTLQSSSNG
jgi:hypothetical protein